ncbi:hypothetical protein [Corynebacterium gallinarum]|nr:hypothetical protein [Corynebacterium gallinarum]
MKRMTVVATLTIALLAGVAPCSAHEAASPVTIETAAHSTTISPAGVNPSSRSVADAVADAAAEASSSATPTPTSEAEAAPRPTNGAQVADSTGTDKGATDRGMWRDVVAEPGQTLHVKFEGDRVYRDLTIETPAQFATFDTVILQDQSIIVFVPSDFTTGATISPVFTISDAHGQLDSFSVTVEYPRSGTTEAEPASPLARLISDIAFRLPQLPFMTHLFKS